MLSEKLLSSPITYFLSKISYFTKFLLILILFAIAFFTAYFNLLLLQNQKIHNINRELQAVSYLRNLRSLMELVPKHHMLTIRFLKGETSLRDEILRLQMQINNELKKIEEDESDISNLSEVLKDDDKHESQAVNIKDLERKWTALSKDVFEMNAEANTLLHEQIIDQQKNILFTLYDNTNFFLNSSTSYLYAISINQLPSIQQIIPLIVLTADKMLTNDKDSEGPRTRLTALLAILQSQINITISRANEAIFQSKTIDAHPQTEYRLKESLDQFEINTKALIEYVEENILTNNSKPKDSFELIKVSSKALNSVFSLNDNAIEQMELLLTQNLQQLQKNKWYLSLIILGAASLAIILLVSSLIQFTGPFNQLVAFLDRFRHGDISNRATVYFNDEIGKATKNLNEVSTIVEGIITQLQRTGIQLMTSTTEIAAAAKEQEITVIQQEATTKEIGVTASEISATAKSFAHTMNNISQSAEETSLLATSGRESLNQMETFMRQMVEASASIAARLGVLSEKASTITSIITTISNVANQTNLLSLNAAIEAEKAGEHGRSFAVIAREIRRLSDQTSNATLDIEKMVNEMVSAVSQGVMGVDKFTEEIRTGVSQVSTVSAQLAKIIEQVQIQTVSFENVNQGMQNQSLGAEQINEAIGQLTEVAQQTSESIRQFHYAIQQLKNVAKEMQTASNVLRS